MRVRNNVDQFKTFSRSRRIKMYKICSLVVIIELTACLALPPFIDSESVEYHFGPLEDETSVLDKYRDRLRRGLLGKASDVSFETLVESDTPPPSAEFIEHVHPHIVKRGPPATSYGVPNKPITTTEKPVEHEHKESSGAGYEYPVPPSIEIHTSPPKTEIKPPVPGYGPPPLPEYGAPPKPTTTTRAPETTTQFIPTTLAPESYPYPPAGVPQHADVEAKSSNVEVKTQIKSSKSVALQENSITIPKELIDIAEKQIKEIESGPHPHPEPAETSGTSNKKTREASDDDDTKSGPPRTSYGIPDSSISNSLQLSSNALKLHLISTREKDAKPNNLLNSSYGVPLSSVLFLPAPQNISARSIDLPLNPRNRTQRSSLIETKKSDPPGASYGTADSSIGDSLKLSSNALKLHLVSTREKDAKPNNLLNSSYGVPLSSVLFLPVEHNITARQIELPEVSTKHTFNPSNRTQRSGFNADTNYDITKSYESAYVLEDGKLVIDLSE